MRVGQCPYCFDRALMERLVDLHEQVLFGDVDRRSSGARHPACPSMGEGSTGPYSEDAGILYYQCRT